MQVLGLGMFDGASQLTGMATYTFSGITKQTFHSTPGGSTNL
jgi:hypothetical protein